MKVILVMVSSINGKITKGDDPNIYTWTSKEDAKLFFSLVKRHNLIVMGSKTYEAIQGDLKITPKKLRVVLTQDPDKYADKVVPGSLEFSSGPPGQLVRRLEKRGYKTMLLTGGGVINTLFFKSNLIDELWLTIEPNIFGSGQELAAKDQFAAKLKLKSCKKLNPQGTLHLRYLVRS